MQIIIIFWTGIYICFGLVSYYISLTISKDRVVKTKDFSLLYLYFHGRIFIVVFAIVTIYLLVLGLMYVTDTAISCSNISSSQFD